MFEKLYRSLLIVTFLTIGSLGESHPAEAAMVPSHQLTNGHPFHELARAAKIKKAHDLMERVTPKG